MGVTGIKQSQGHLSGVLEGARRISKELLAWQSRQRALLHGGKVLPAPIGLWLEPRGTQLLRLPHLWQGFPGSPNKLIKSCPA